MSAPERIPPQPELTADDAQTLARGELTVHGRITSASNTVLYATADLAGHRLPCVYKPVAGERPLWDFPDGTLAQREVAAYEVSRALGFDLVPPTVLRDGPLGEGMVQLWVGPAPGAAREEDEEAEELARKEAAEAEAGGGAGPGQLLALLDAEEPGEGWKAVGFARLDEHRTALLVHADDERLARVAALDAVINNGDRKGGHLLPLPDGRLYGIDHGVTFHTENKLRTLLWGWAGEPLPARVLSALRLLDAELAEGRPLADRLRELITAQECAALRARTAGLLRSGRFPEPSGEWPAIPWPLV
ncbi:SCO1664 family protein [Streptomyces hoynatensis]|uniref:SCO1664 family protein n=1 Tax=Streptomyces hoynatensis TaxID=1141874 RepID=A0A3A9YQH4_9ACTN|nr:SCO1664 family protein [Streptomyces hoynatensis]RKN38200.1 SCO1664 family protein [Streptomyces hoynatensis]